MYKSLCSKNGDKRTSVKGEEGDCWVVKLFRYDNPSLHFRAETGHRVGNQGRCQGGFHHQPVPRQVPGGRV